jgi:branched-chain amino acid transport system permease protein
MALADIKTSREVTARNQKNIKRLLQVVGFIVAIPLIAFLLAESTGQSYFNLLQYTINGVLVGGVYALVALGIVIINKASGIFNFAHGFMMLLGGLVFYECYRGTPSDGLTAVLGVLTAVILLIFTIPVVSPSEAGGSRWAQLLRTPRFWMALAGALVSAIVVAILMKELKDEIVRGAIGGIVASAALGLAVERFAIRPLLGQPTLAAIMMTLAVALLLQGVVALVWGGQSRSLPIFMKESEQTITRIAIGTDPQTGATLYREIASGSAGLEPLPSYRVSTGDLFEGGNSLIIARNLIWGFLIAILCFAGFVVFFQFTPIGLAMRASAENQVLAQSVGLRVRSILALAWAIAAAMAMVAAVIQGSGPSVGVSALVLPPLAFRAFPAVLLGGLESITGALVGGILMGVVELLATALIDSATGQEFAPFAVMMLVLMVKPDGLFGQRRVERV